MPLFEYSYYTNLFTYELQLNYIYAFSNIFIWQPCSPRQTYGMRGERVEAYLLFCNSTFCLGLVGILFCHQISSKCQKVYCFQYPSYLGRIYSTGGNVRLLWDRQLEGRTDRQTYFSHSKNHLLANNINVCFFV